MNTATFNIGQKVERKGKFYIVFEVFPHNNNTDRDIAVKCMNKKTVLPWQAPMYFNASEFTSADLTPTK